MSASQIHNLENWFNENHIKIRRSWLTQCVEYFLSKNKNISLQDLREQAYQQWLLNDIADTSLSNVPELNKSIKNIEGNYAVQLHSLMDISAPAYTQLKKFYNEPVEQLEEEQEDSSSRVLKLILSDSAKTIKAMEYQPIKSLSLNTLPGSKLLLRGPIKVSFNGILYLENHNVTLLGGEVDTLIEPNSVLNTLMKSINLSADHVIFNRCKASPSTINRPQIPATTTTTTARSNTNQQITKPQSNITNKPSTNTNLDQNRCNSPSFLLDGMEDAFLEDFDVDSINVPSSENTFMQALNHTHIEKDLNKTKHILDPSYPIKHNNKTVIFFNQVDEIRSMVIEPKMFIVIIKIEKFIQKLCMEDDKWQNLVRVSDYLADSANYTEHIMDVHLDSDLISKYTGYDAQRMNDLKIKLKDNPDLINDLLLSLRDMKNDFMSKIFLAEIKIFPQILDQPSIIFNLEELESKHNKLIAYKKDYE